MARDVFISHAGDDASIAVEVCALLEKRGLKCWMAPRDVAAGSVWDEAILDAIETSRVFLLILSKSANDSQYVKNEVNRAFSERKPIVTFRLENVMPGRSLQLYLARHHWTDAFPPPMGVRVETLATSITALLDLPAPAAAAPAALPPRPMLAARLLSPLLGVAKRVRDLGSLGLNVSLIALLLGAAIAGFAAWNLKPTPPKPVTRTVINLPPGDRLVFDQTSLALSPDGKLLAYAAIRGGTSQLYLRAMDSMESTPIAGTEGAKQPFFSPDNQSIGFFAGGKLKKVSVSGGAAITLGDASDPLGGTWGSRGTIVFEPIPNSPLLQVLEAGGTPQPVTHLEKGDADHIWPEFLPGGTAVLFAAGGGPLGSLQIDIQSLATGERRHLVGGTQPRYAASGHLIYAQGTTLMAVAFDPQRLEIKGTPVAVVESLANAANYGSSQYSISDTGSLIYLSGGIQGAQRSLVWVDRKGTEQVLPTPPRPYRTPRISPDGRRIAIGGVDADIWIYDLGRDTLSRLTFQSGTNPVWSPDGKHVTFGSNGGKGNTNVNLYSQPADGSGSAERLTTFGENQHNAGSWSSDGQFLSFEEIHPTTNRDIWVFRMSDHKAEPFLHTQFNETASEFSPDGRWLVYASDESGRYEIYVQAYPGPGGKWQISTEGGTEPRWAGNGEIFYRSGNRMMAAETTTKGGFSAGKPKMLFEGRYVPTLLTKANYDVTPDGQRFLMVKAAEQEVSATQINVVLNWFEELKQKVPTGKN